MSVLAVPAGSSTGHAATPLIDQWLVATRLAERGRARLQPADLLFWRIATDALVSEPARRLLGDLHSMLSKEMPSLGRTQLGPDERENQLALGVAESLATVGLLRAVHRSGSVLDFSLNAQGSQAGARLRAFVAGPWLEIGVEQALRSVLGESAEVARNLKAEHPTHGELELDVVAIVDGAPVVFECKSGRRVAETLPRFGDVIRIVGVEGDRAVVVAPHMDPREAAIAEGFLSIRIMGPDEVGSHAARLGATTVPGRTLRLVETAEAPTPEQRSTEAEGTGTETTGAKQKLALGVAARAELEAIVHRVVDGSPGTQTATQLAVDLRDRTLCSRVKANYVVTGLLHAGRLLDADGRPVKTYSATVHKVAHA